MDTGSPCIAITKSTSYAAHSTGFVNSGQFQWSNRHSTKPTVSITEEIDQLGLDSRSRRGFLFSTHQTGYRIGPRILQSLPSNILGSRCISTKRFRLSLKTKERLRSMAHRSSRIAISPLPRDTIRRDRTRMFGSIVGHEAISQFLEGLSNFDLVTDHRPLIPILNEYS